MLITIYFEKIQINVETIYSHFRGFGDIQKIIIFRKKNYQIFIELASMDEALRFKKLLQAQNFDHLFNLKIQFTQKKELVVNNNTMMEFDFTKAETESYSDFHNGSYSDLPNKAYSDKHNKLFFAPHREGAMMTPESINKMLCLPEYSDGTRFMTPKGAPMGGHARDNCPASAKLKHKLATTRSFNPYSAKMGDCMYPINIFENLLHPRGFGMRQKLTPMDQTQKRLSPLTGIDWLASQSSAANRQSDQKPGSETKDNARTRKTLSLKEKYKRKILANKRKKKLKQAKDAAQDTAPPLSTESKVTLEKPCKDAQESTRARGKGPDGDDSARDKQEKTTAKKKSTIINPNVVVNNFSFKGDPKAESNSFLQNQSEARPQPARDSEFSLTNLKENLSDEFVDDHKMNIFRVFDHENSSEKMPIMSPKPVNDPRKGIDDFLDLKHDCLSRQTSRDSFREFDFKMSSERHASDEDSDPGERPPDGFDGEFGDTLSDVALKRLAQMSGELECLQEPVMQSPMDTLKNTYMGKLASERIQLATPSMGEEFLTFHSKCDRNRRTGACAAGVQCAESDAK